MTVIEELRAARRTVQQAVAAERRGLADQVKVTLQCGRCYRRLDRVRTKGDSYQSLDAQPGYSEVAGPSREGDNLRDRLLGPAGERVRYRCRCGADWPVRRGRLGRAVRAAAAQDPRHRVVVIPADL
jgi:bacterioferritin-associated ferredoxin